MTTTFSYSEIEAAMTQATDAYLRTCSSGGMPKKLENQIRAAVQDIIGMPYLSLALAEQFKNRTP